MGYIFLGVITYHPLIQKTTKNHWSTKFRPGDIRGIAHWAPRKARALLRVDCVTEVGSGEFWACEVPSHFFQANCRFRWNRCNILNRMLWQNFSEYIDYDVLGDHMVVTLIICFYCGSVLVVARHKLKECVFGMFIPNIPIWCASDQDGPYQV